jgi:hypothetical protein
LEKSHGLALRAEFSPPIHVGCGFESQRIQGESNQLYFFEKNTTTGSQLGHTKNKVSLFMGTNTVKPVLMATYEQQPPVNNGQTKSGQANFDTNFDLKTSIEQPPVYKGGRCRLV